MTQSRFLSFAGTMALEGQAPIYVEFALEASREQLAGLLQALLRPAKSLEGEPVEELRFERVVAPDAVSSNKVVITSNKTPVSSKAPASPSRFRRRDIVAEDIREDMAPEEKLALIIEGFRKSSDVRYLSIWARQEYKKLTGTAYKGEEFGDLAEELGLDEDDTGPGLPDRPRQDPIEIDLQKLRAIPREELVKPDGTVNQSEIARRLGYSTGGGKWDHIREVAAHLQAEYDEADAAAA